MKRMMFVFLFVFCFWSLGCKQRAIVHFPLYIKLTPNNESLSFYKRNFSGNELISYLSANHEETNFTFWLYCFVEDGSTWRETSLFLEQLAALDFVKVIIVSNKWPPYVDSPTTTNVTSFIWGPVSEFPLDGGVCQGTKYLKMVDSVSADLFLQTRELLKLKDD